MEQEEIDARNKRGYLHEDFRFFHLRDKQGQEFEFHYHDFNKIIFFLSGSVEYRIEGKAYRLRPWDILLVSQGQLHRAVITPDAPYERIIIWVNSKFLADHSTDGNLLSCFEQSASAGNNLLRLGEDAVGAIRHVLFHLENAMKEDGFGVRLLQNSLFLQLVISLNRLCLGKLPDLPGKDVVYDRRVGEILSYINGNLEKDLSLENLAALFFISKYHLMHTFKAQTGYTVYNYIIKKRLIRAARLIKKGTPAAVTSEKCGFGDYSSFERAFRKEFGVSPRNYNKMIGIDSTGYED